MLTFVQVARRVIILALQNRRQLLVADSLPDGFAAKRCRTLCFAAAEAHAAVSGGNSAVARQRAD